MAVTKIIRNPSVVAALGTMQAIHWACLHRRRQGGYILSTERAIIPIELRLHLIKLPRNCAFEYVHHLAEANITRHLRVDQRMAGAGIELTVATRGDRCDNALAEAVSGMFEAELLRTWSIDHLPYRKTTADPASQL